MNTLKILTISAVAFTSALLIVCLSIEDPLKSQYQNTVEKLMAMENISSEAALLAGFPELETAKEYIIKADKLEFQIQSATGGPGVRIDEEKSNALIEMQKEMKHLRNEAAYLLSQVYPKKVKSPSIKLAKYIPPHK